MQNKATSQADKKDAMELKEKDKQLDNQKQKNPTVKSEQNIETHLNYRKDDPRRAATRLKKINENIEIMRRRCSVLQEQQGYNKYKTVDHETKLGKHLELHKKLLEQKQVLKKSLEKQYDTKQLRVRANEIRGSLRQNIRSARQQILQEKLQRSSLIAQQQIKHSTIIKENKQEEETLNKRKKQAVVFEQAYQKQNVSRYVQDKKSRIKSDRKVDTSQLEQKAISKQKQLNRLFKYEQELLKKQSESLEMSQIVKKKFQMVFRTSSPIEASRIFPEIKPQSNQSKYTNSTQIMMV